MRKKNALPLHQRIVGNHGKEWFLLGELVCRNCHRSEGETLPHEDQLQLPPPELIATPGNFLTYEVGAMQVIAYWCPKDVKVRQE